MARTTRRATALVAAVFAAATLSACTTAEESGFTLDPSAVTCFVDGSSGLAVLQIPLSVEADIGFDPDILRVEFDSPQNVSLAGIGLADSAAYEANTPLPPEDLDSLVARRDETMLYLPVDRSDSPTLVVLLETLAPGPGTIDSFRIFWGGGEPIYWQVLDVAAVVEDVCTVTPG